MLVDRLTKKQRSYNMSRVRSKNTEPERVMCRLLEKGNFKFEKHYPIAGKPDIAFPEHKLAIFIDGEFWHGRDFDKWGSKLSSFWHKKIGENIKRDRKNYRILRKRGWHVMRLWDKKLLRNPRNALRRVSRFIKRIQGGSRGFR